MPAASPATSSHSAREPRLVRLPQCQFATLDPAGIAIPGFRRGLPEACIVRSVSGGTFEAVTRRLGVLHALRELGVLVWNDARVIERCVDKSMTTFLLQRAGIAVPRTWTAETRDMAAAIAECELRRGPLVLKPLFGSQGRGLRLIAAIDDLPAAEEVDGVYYLQRFMGVERDRRFRDFRIFVVNGSPVAGMTRRCQSWITNVRQGGTPEPLARDRQLEELAVARRRGRRCRFLRRRPAARRRWRSGGARGQQHAGLERAAEGERRRHRGGAGPRHPRRALGTPSRAGQALTVAPDQIAAAYVEACLAELAAPKPGNVHVFAGGHGMEAAHFLAAARASANPLAEPRQPVGMRIFNAVEASMKIARTNTNLGIVLLCAPLAAAAEAGRKLRDSLRHVLETLDQRDASLAFRAIVLAGPGGMGTEAVNDIRSEPACTLRQAMAQAAHRDRIARAYVTIFEDVWSLGLPALAAAEAEQLAEWWPAVAVHLEYLAAFPDSHIVRKWGHVEAQWVKDEASALLSRQRRSGSDPAALQQALLALDRRIKARGLNPGTSADLTVATLFAARLVNILRNLPDSG